MAPELRPRTRSIAPASCASSTADFKAPAASHITPLSPSHTPSSCTTTSAPPLYTIDLSLPPAERYLALATANKALLHTLPAIFDTTLADFCIPARLVHLLARLFLRRVCSPEQHAELLGISRAAGLPLRFLVAYNVLLDLFMGCTSGAAFVQPPDADGPRMMHFRTLDWGMPALRDFVAQFAYVSESGGPVVARCIGYVGFVGVLTGLREGLSVSLNFRPYHNDDTSLRANVRFVVQQLKVVLGRSPSIASTLREYVVPSQGKLRYCTDDILRRLPSLPTTAAYLIFCTEHESIVLEKDHTTAKVLRSDRFIVTTNHDAQYDSYDKEAAETAHLAHTKKSSFGIGMHDLVDESVDRKRCLTTKWEDWCVKQRSKLHRSSRTSKKVQVTEQELDHGVPLSDLQEWMQDYPTTNEDTHFACIMDPKDGVFGWVRWYDEGEIKGD